MTGAPKGSTKSGFMEMLVIKPASPGLRGIGLSPTPWGLSFLVVMKKMFVASPWVVASTGPEGLVCVCIL